MNACEKCLTRNRLKEGEVYVRTEEESEEWPNKRMPIVLCGRHAKKRKPLTNNEIDTIMKKILPSTLLMICLFVVGCSAQTLETMKTISPAGYVITAGTQGTPVGVDPGVFKGAKGDAGPQGLPGAKGEQGATGAQGPKGDSADIVYILPGAWFTDLNDGRDIGTAYATKTLHYIVIAGTVKLYEGTFKIKYSYTDGSGVDQIGSYDVTKVGPFTTGLIPIYTRPTTLMKIYTEVTGNVFYDIAYNFHGL